MTQHLRRVVITGMGIISCIGNSIEEVSKSLKAGKSGIIGAPDYHQLGFRSQVYGKPQINPEELIDKRLYRFMGDAAAYVHLAMTQAIKHAGLEEKDVSNERTGIIVGSGGPSTKVQVAAAETTLTKGPKRVGPFAVPKCMSSTTSATAATNFKIKGVNYSISSACSTSAHCIGNAAEQIQWGKQDVMFAGGGEDLDWTLSVLFDAMGAMSSKYNDTPRAHPAPTTKTATASSFPAAAELSCLKSLNTPKRAAQKSTAKSPATAQHPTAPTWSPRAARAQSAACAGALNRQNACDLHQHARHIDAGRRHHRTGRHPRSVRREEALYQRDQIHDRPLPRRDRRAGSDLLPADDEREFRRPQHQRREHGRGRSRHAHRDQAH
jgi:hypothetical protein